MEFRGSIPEMLEGLDFDIWQSRYQVEFWFETGLSLACGLGV